MIRGIFVILATLAVAHPSGQAADSPFRDGRRVVFLGDSITQNGLFIQYIDAYMFTRFPDRVVELIPLGLSSETVSGNTEEGHPYPRPDARERVGRALGLAKPNVVAICYGMNDGIYAPPDPARLEVYQRGITELVDAAREAGAEVVVATPPPFDAQAVRAKVRPIGEPRYGYQRPYADYDGVLNLYSQWLLSKRDDGWLVADIHGSTRDYLAFARSLEPDAVLARDGVHPEAAGHWLIARAYLDAWGAPAEVDAAAIDAASKRAVRGRVDGIESGEDGSIRFSWTTKIPMPSDPKWDEQLIRRERIADRINRHRLIVVGLDRDRYAISEGDAKVGEATREQLAEGVDLLGLPGLSTNRRAAEIGPLVARRYKILQPAWLEAVGHKAPVFPKAPQLDEAKAKAAEIEATIRQIARPVPIALRLSPI